MKTKTSKYLALLAFALVLCMSSVMAATTFVAPTSSGTIRGNASVFNVTSSMTNLTNCTVTGSSALTSDSLAASTLLSAAGRTYANLSIDTTGLEDASDWTFTGTCFNTTSNVAITTITGVIVDNTVPVAPTISTTSASDNKAITITADVTAARTTACTMTLTSSFHQTGTLAMTHSGTSCTYSNLNVPGSGDFVLTVTATDGLNSTTTSTNYKVDQKKGNIVAAQAQIIEQNESAQKKDNQQTVILIVVLIAIFGYYKGWIGKKKR